MLILSNHISPQDAFDEAEKKLAIAKKAEADASKLYEEARAEMMVVLDHLHGENAPCRIVSPSTGMVVSRELRPVNPYDHPKINEGYLQSLLTKEQWNLVTDEVRVINQEKLISALDEKQIPAELFTQSVEYPQQQVVLNYRKLTKEDKIQLEVERINQRNVG